MALTKDRTADRSSLPYGRQRGGKVGAAVIIFKGAALCWNASGYLVPGANTAGFKFAGWADQYVDNSTGAAGAKKIQYTTGISETMANASGGNAVAQAHLGGPVWLHDDDTVRSTPSNVFLGIAEEIEPNGRIRVFGGPEAGAGVIEPVHIVYEHPAANADATHKLFTVPAGKKFRLTRAEYTNPTGLAANGSAYFNVKAIQGSTVMASWSSQTSGGGGQGAIVADTPFDLVNSATDADLVAAAGTVVALFLDETGDTTLPLGRIAIHGYLIPA